MTNKLQYLFKKFISLPYWWIIFSFFLFLWTCQTNPPLDKEKLYSGLWEVQISQSKDLLDNDFLNNVMYGYNRALRLSYPIIAKLLDFSKPKQLFIFQLFLGLLFQFLIVKTCLKISKNNIIGTILFGFISSYYYFSNAASGDTYGHGDTIAFVFILLAMYIDNPFMIFLFLFGAFFSNERSLLVSLPTVWIWWFLNEKKDKIILWGSIPASVIAYYACKYFLLNQPHFKADLPNDIGFFYLLNSHTFFNMYVFTFGGLWIVVFYWIYKLKQIPVSLLIILFFSVSAFIVADQTRGISFIFPLFFIAFREVHRIGNNKEINNVLICGAILTLFIPNFVFFGEYTFKPSLFYHLLEKNIIIPVDWIFANFFKSTLNI